MSLLDIRKKFVKATGRYDLVVDTTDWADNGADDYITQGQRMLDRKISFGFGKGKYLKDLTIGDYKLSLAGCRVIQEVWVADATSRTRLDKIDENILRGVNGPFRDSWYTEPFADITTGRPLYYHPASLRRVPDNGSVLADSATLTSYLDTVAAYDGSFTGIVFLPPADEAYVIEVVGLFYTEALSDDADVNFWTVNYPNILIMAAVYQYRLLYHGASKIKDSLAAIDTELADVEMDFVAEETNSTTQMEG